MTYILTKPNLLAKSNSHNVVLELKYFFIVVYFFLSFWSIKTALHAFLKREFVKTEQNKNSNVLWEAKYLIELIWF